MTIKQIQIAAPAKKPAAKKMPVKKAAPKKEEKPKLSKGADEPTAYFQSLERNRKGSMKVMQKQWKKAVKKAEDEGKGKGKKGPYIMRIFKNLMGISTAATETAELKDFKVMVSFPDPSGKGIASKTYVRKASTPEGAKKGMQAYIDRNRLKGYRVTRVVKADAGGLPGIGNEPTTVNQMPSPGGPVGGPAGKDEKHPFDVAGLTKPNTKDPKLADDAPFDYERWKNSGKPPRKSNLIRTNKDGKLELVPRKGLPKK